jgi:hypothetical protein
MKAFVARRKRECCLHTLPVRAAAAAAAAYMDYLYVY